MRLITQDGLRSYNFNHLAISVNGHMITTTIDNKMLVLGKYESEKRALEVFNEMHNADYLHYYYRLPEE